MTFAYLRRLRVQRPNVARQQWWALVDATTGGTYFGLFRVKGGALKAAKQHCIAILPEGIQPAHYEYLREFARRHGHTWKAQMRSCWNAEHCSPELQHIKSTLGDAGLTKWRF